MNDHDLEPTVGRLFASLGGGDSPTDDERDRMHAAMMAALGTSEPGAAIVLPADPWLDEESTVVDAVVADDAPHRRSPIWLAAAAATVLLVVIAGAVLRTTGSAVDVANGVPDPTIRIQDDATVGLVRAVDAQIGSATIQFVTGEEIVVDSFGPDHLLLRPIDSLNPFASAQDSLGGQVLLFAPQSFTDAVSLNEFLARFDLDVEVLAIPGDAGPAATTIIVPDGSADADGCAVAVPCINLNPPLMNGPTPAIERGFVNDLRLASVSGQPVAVLTLHTGTRIGSAFDSVTRLRDDVAATLSAG